MADKLSFQLDLTGDMATALRGVVAQLDATEKGMGKTRGATTELEKELQKLQGAAKPLIALEWGNMFDDFAGFRRTSEGQWVFNVARGIEAIGSAASRAASFLKDLTIATVKAVSAEEDLSLAERLNLGAGGAAQTQEIGNSFSNTRFDDGTVRKALLPLERAGIRDRDLLDNLATAAADIEALTAGDVKMGEALASLGKVATKREFGEKQLESLGLNANDVMANLNALMREQLGWSKEKVKQKLGEGAITGETLLSVILDEMGKKNGGLGVPAMEAGKTWGATLQRLADLPDNVLKQAKGTAGLDSLQKLLEQFVTVMQGDGIKQAVEGFTYLLQGVLYVAVGLGAGLYYAGEAVGWLAAKVALGIGAAFDWVVAAPGRMWEAAKSIGSALMDGVVDGIGGALDTVRQAIEGAADSTVSWFKEKLGIASPSRVFRELGGYVGEGYALGLEDSAGRVESAAESMMIDQPAARSGSGAAGRSGAAVTSAAGHVFHFNITGSDASDISDRVAAKVEAILAGHYERVAAEA